MAGIKGRSGGKRANSGQKPSINPLKLKPEEREALTTWEQSLRKVDEACLPWFIEMTKGLLTNPELSDAMKLGLMERYIRMLPKVTISVKRDESKQITPGNYPDVQVEFVKADDQRSDS